MKYETFKELWDKQFPNGFPKFRNSKNRKVIKQEGCSQATTDLLIAYGKGDPKAKAHFAKIAKYLDEEKARQVAEESKK